METDQDPTEEDLAEAYVLEQASVEGLVTEEVAVSAEALDWVSVEVLQEFILLARYLNRKFWRIVLPNWKENLLY